MRILIDGYNLLHASTIVPAPDRQGSLQQTRNALLDFLIAKLPDHIAQQTTVVFDKGTERGLAAQSRYGPLTVEFALRYPEADDRIEELIRQNHAPRRLTVVSSDHRVQRAARRRKARAIDSEVWLQELVHDQRTPGTSSLERVDRPGSKNEWMALFGDVDVDAIQRELESDSGFPVEKTVEPDNATEQGPSTNRPTKPTQGDASSPFPEKHGEDLLRDDERLFPEGYGEDLLEDES